MRILAFRAQDVRIIFDERNKYDQEKFNKTK